MKNVIVQGQLFRSRDGIKVETSFNNGIFWMSSAKSIKWFKETIEFLGGCEAPEGEFLG